MEEREAGYSECRGAHIRYGRALERARNEHLDDASDYRLVDIDRIDGISSGEHLFQLLEDISAARQDYCHDLEAYGRSCNGDLDSIDDEELAELGYSIYQELI